MTTSEIAAKNLPKILIVQTGTAGPLVEQHGDYPAWFRRSLGADEETMPALLAHQGERLSLDSIHAFGARGLIVTGSPLSVTSRERWMEELGEELLRAARRGLPILGVCFGHQLLCQASGAFVVQNPRGREIGTVQVQLTEAGAKDPLFAWAANDEAKTRQIAVQATHVDAVYPVPAGAVLLASNESTPVQAVRFQEHVASVQFHPEVAPQLLRDLVESRRELLAREGLDANAILRSARETQSGQLLRAFAEQVRHS